MNAFSCIIATAPPARFKFWRNFGICMASQSLSLQAEREAQP